MRIYEVWVIGRVYYTGSYDECKTYMTFSPVVASLGDEYFCVAPKYDVVATCEEVAWAIHRCHAQAALYSQKVYRASMNDYIEQRDFYSAIMERWLSAIKILNQVHLFDSREAEKAGV